MYETINKHGLSLSNSWSSWMRKTNINRNCELRILKIVKILWIANSENCENCVNWDFWILNLKMSRQTVYVQHCSGVNGLEKIILREVRGFSAEVFVVFIIHCEFWFLHYLLLQSIAFIFCRFIYTVVKWYRGRMILGRNCFLSVVRFKFNFQMHASSVVFFFFQRIHVSFFTPFLLQASFKPPNSIRGGIPICFPQVCVSILFPVFLFLHFLFFF